MIVAESHGCAGFFPMNRGLLLLLRSLVAGWLLLLSGVACSRAADTLRDFDIPAGEAETALRTFAHQAAVQLIFDPQLVEHLITPAVRGRFAAETALRKLLAGAPVEVIRDKQTGAFALKKKSDSSVMEKRGQPVLHGAPGPSSGQPTSTPDSMSKPSSFSPRHRGRWSRIVSGLAAFVTAHLGAQTTGAPTGPDSTPANRPVVADTASEVLQLDEFVVTGTARGMRKFDSAFSISTMSEERISRVAPLGPVDLASKLPGFWTEPSGGEGGNNMAVRGLPDSSFLFVGFLEDGLPNYQEQQGSFLNADELLRVDATIEGVEAVRGGTASIFSTNTPGATINFLTKRGTQTRAGLLRLTLSDFGQLRWDGVVSGPLSKDLTYSVGGFYRRDDGPRDVGFTADRGGQFRVSLTEKFENGSVTAYFKDLNDRTVFYTPIPLRDPRNPSVLLADVLDPSSGTMTSNDFRFAQIRTLNGTAAGTTLAADLADGIHSAVITGGVIAELKFGDGWNVTNHFRYVDGSVGFNGIFSGPLPDDAASFLAQQLTRAQAAFGSSVVNARYVLANSRNANGSIIAFDPNSTHGLVLRDTWSYVTSDISNVMDDLRVSKTFETPVGRHLFSVGVNYSEFSLYQRQYQNQILMQLKDHPKALDIQALDAAGNVVGYVTENGFLQYGTNGGVGGQADGRMIDPYAVDTWQVNRALRLDAGFRLHTETDSGYALLRSVQNVAPSSTSPLALTNVGGASGQIENRRAVYNDKAWTFGANYELTPALAFFGRYTYSFRTPRLNNIYVRSTAVEDFIREGELGVKYSSPTLAVFASVFGNRFSPLSDTVLLPDANGVLQNISFKSKTETLGAEIEATWTPTPWFVLGGNVTIQRPEYSDLVNITTGAPVAGADGKQIRRIPKYLAHLEPRFNFKLGGVHTEVYGSYNYSGERFVDYSNLTRLPGFSTVDAGVIFHFGDAWEVQFAGSNLTGSLGLTEGNPRVDVFSGQGARLALYGRPILPRSFRSMVTFHF